MTRNGSKFEGLTTQALIDLAKEVSEMKGMLLGYEKRISTLEKWRWLLTGGIAVLATTKFPGIAHLLNLQ